MISFLNYPKLILAGKSSLTIKNPATGNHVKIRVKRCKDKKTDIPLPIFFVKVAILGDQESGYVYTGTFFSDTKRFKQAANLKQGSQLEKITAFLVNAISRPEILQKTEILHEGKCCRCGRTLTHPESIKSGIGPECSKYI